MKKIIKEFFRRGLIACGFGPIVLAIVYLVLQKNGVIETLTVNQVCIGIFSITALAFIAGSMNALYQIERLPLMVAILIHGVVLYFTYLGTYLLNDWLELGLIPFLIFTGVFVVGYLVIWVIIYSINSKSAATLNMLLEQKQQSLEEM
ncbi:MAG: DUF3021 domain-containing protein [Lachnospiraceae bacterium]|nr:DUF3021 domain-containing protein [Lachnospiraceae bacterium]